MVTSLSHLDFTKKYSYADYIKWQFTERLELLKGYLQKLAAPSSFHQEISGNLFTTFKSYIRQSQKPCKVFHAPFDVRFYSERKSMLADKDIFTVVQPDICVICDRSKIDQRGCLGAPDFIIEILSDSNPKTDLKDKFKIYQEYGVTEYWIAFPDQKMIQKFVLTEGKYQLEGMYVENEEISPNLFPDLKVDLTEIFEEI